MSDQDAQTESRSRRSFFKRALATIIGGILAAFPFVSGIIVWFDPLRKKKKDAGMVRVASLSSLPDDGVPRKFKVISDKQDAWNTYPNVPVGAVYLKRTGAQEVEAFNVVCPHLGCAVDFQSKLQSYYCPCHNSTFAIDGKINDPKSPSPRDMDKLDVEIRNGGQVWIRFQNFRPGTKEPVLIS